MESSLPPAHRSKLFWLLKIVSQRERGSTDPSGVASGFPHVIVEFLVISDSPAAAYFGIRHPILHLPCLNYFMTPALIPRVPLVWESTEVTTPGQ